MSDEVLIWIGLFFVASSPFILAVALRPFLPLPRCRLICHGLSGVLLLFLGVTYLLAAQAYSTAGYDDGSQDMSAFLLSATALVVIPENLLLCVLWRKRSENESA